MKYTFLRGPAATVGLALGLAAIPSVAHAYTIRIGCGDINGLKNAISALDNPAGGTIELAEGCTYSYTSGDEGGENALPSITNNTNIKITGAHTTIERSATAAALFRLFHIEPQASLTLRGITVRGGHINADGGGILNEGKLTLVDSAVTGNTADGNAVDGGGIANEDGTVTLRNSTVNGNTAAGSGTDGGGISNNAKGTLKLEHSEVRNNSAPGVTGGAEPDGGGIQSQGAVTIEDSTISHNTVGNGGDGGGINSLGSLKLRNVQITDNTADLDGGGINSGEPGTIESTKSTLAGNRAKNGGGLNNEGWATLTSTRIIENAVTGQGGGIHNESNSEDSEPTPAHLTLDDSAITQNTAGDGGGIYSESGAVVRLEDTSVRQNKPNNCVPAVGLCG
ncbi:hypothetical protein ACWEWI_22790 [Streptomyces sp. NPDC003753]